MATLSLAEAAITVTEPLKKGVMLGIAREGVVADILNFRDTGVLTETGVRYDEVITPDWVALDGTIASKTARGKQLAWGVYEMSVHMDVPIALEMSGDRLETPSVRQITQATLGAAYVLNDQFINGDQGSEPNGFNGIEKIVGNLASGQTVLGSAEIDIRTTGTDSATRQNLIDRLDEAIDACEGHGPTIALCSRQFALRTRSMLRRENLLGDNHNWVTDGFPFGDVRQSIRTASTNPSFVYQGIPFYDLGFQADQTTNVISNTSDDGDGARATHIYFVKLGEDDLEGLQYSPLEILNIGILEDKNNERHRLNWRVGIAVWGPRSISIAGRIRVA